jgi:hypothetical protein
MNAKEEIAKITLTKIIGGVILLITLLAAIVWRETLAGKLEQAMAGWSTKGLSALLGLTLIVIVIETLTIAYLSYLIYRHRQIPRPPRILRRHGVHWDEHQNPLCPVCETLLTLRKSLLSDADGPEYLQCPKCRNAYTLRTDRGSWISLTLAKANLRHAIKKNRFQISD